MPNPNGAGQDLVVLPAHTATEDTAEQVRTMAACGLSVEQVCQILPCKPADFDRCYSEIFRDGALQANVQVGAAVLRAATNPNHEQFFQCASFWLRARAGWRDVREIKTDAKLPDEQRQALIDQILTQITDVTTLHKEKVNT